jgi:hypothetical protein
MTHLFLRPAGFANIINHYTIPTYPAMSSFLMRVFSSSRPNLLICDFLVDACADVADTLGINYAISMSGIPPGGEPLADL